MTRTRTYTFGEHKPIVFLDTETTGLDWDQHVMWEFGGFRINNLDKFLMDVDELEVFEFQIVPGNDHMRVADPVALDIGGFWDRMNPTEMELWGTAGGGALAVELYQFLNGATIVGAVPWFDTRHIETFLKYHGLPGGTGSNRPWHYHLVDIESMLAAGNQQLPPWKYQELLQGAGIETEKSLAHSALYDAQIVMEAWFKVMGLELPPEFHTQGYLPQNQEKQRA